MYFITPRAQGGVEGSVRLLLTENTSMFLQLPLAINAITRMNVPATLVDIVLDLEVKPRAPWPNEGNLASVA